MKRKIKLSVELEDINDIFNLCMSSDMRELGYMEAKMISKYYENINADPFQIFRDIYNFSNNLTGSINAKYVNLTTRDISFHKPRRDNHKLLDILFRDEYIKYTNYKNIHDMISFIKDLSIFGEPDDIFPKFRDCKFLSNPEIKEFIKQKIIIENELDRYEEELYSIQLLIGEEVIPFKQFKFTRLYVLRSCMYNVAEISRHKYLNKVETKYLDKYMNYFLQSLSIDTLYHNNDLVKFIDKHKKDIIATADKGDYNLSECAKDNLAILRKSDWYKHKPTKRLFENL